MFTCLQIGVFGDAAGFTFSRRKGKMKPHRIYKKLDQAIRFVVENKERYVKNPNADFTRNRKLTLESTIKQILAMDGGTLEKELCDFTEINKIYLTSSAFIQQRSKIRSAAFETIFKEFNVYCNDRQKFKGYRLLAVDGSDVNQYRNPKLKSFITYPGNEKGYNQTHLNAIYDLLNKTYVDAFLQPRPKANEQRALIEMLKRNSFQKNNILIADRGYESYNTIAHCMNAPNLDFLLRVRHGNGSMLVIRNLPMVELDKDVTLEVTTTQTKEDKANGRIHIPIPKHGKTYKSSKRTRNRTWDFPSPYELKFRVVRFMLDTGEYETVVTSLPRNKFSISDIKYLYHMRWGIETSFRELKYNIGLINLHCKKEELVEQEIYAALTMYNYCSRITANASIEKSGKRLYEYRVNFTMAIRFCKKQYKYRNTDFRKLILDISRYTEPIRPGRHDKRNVKNKQFVGFTYRIAA